MTSPIVTTMIKLKVDDFTERFIDDRERYSSKPFLLNGMPGAEFQIVTSKVTRDVHFYCKDIGQNAEIKLSIKFWLESSGNKFNQCLKKCVFNESGKCSESFLPNEFPTLLPLIVGDSLTICFEIKQGDLGFEEHTIDATKTIIFEKFVSNIGELLSEGYSDLTIEADGKEFKAFKNILMAHSEIFEIMLSSPNSLEAQTGVIKMENVSAAVVKVLIQWTHTFKVDNIDEISEGLYKVSHKYEIYPLMKICVNSIMESLTVDNLPSRTILAYTYDIEDLKYCIPAFVQDDHQIIQTLIASDEWIDFAYENRELAKKITEELLNQTR